MGVGIGRRGRVGKVQWNREELEKEYDILLLITLVCNHLPMELFPLRNHLLVKRFRPVRRLAGDPPYSPAAPTVAPTSPVSVSVATAVDVDVTATRTPRPLSAQRGGGGNSRRARPPQR